MSLLTTTLILLLFGGSKSDIDAELSAEVERIIQRDCYKKCTSETLCIRLYGEEILGSFGTDSPDSCKMFCRYAKTCLAFTYISRTTLCTLYEKKPWSEFTLPSDGPANIKPRYELFGDMDCLMKYEQNPSVPCRSLSTVMTLSQTSRGMLIEKLFTGKCLGYGTSSSLEWIDCGSATLWRFQKSAMFHSSEEKTAIVEIKPADSTNKCMTSAEKDAIPIVTVAECQAENESQQFHFSTGTLPKLRALQMHDAFFANDCFFQIQSVHREVIYTEGSDLLRDMGLNVINILLPTEYRELCDREQLQTEGVVIEGTAPAFLPGSNITVSCKPGYGFSNFNLATKINVTCRNKQTRIPECEKMITAEDISNNCDSDGEGKSQVGDTSMGDGQDPLSGDEIPSLGNKSTIKKNEEDRSGLFFVLVGGNVGQAVLLVIMGIAIVLLLCKARSKTVDLEA